jgi:hypothetical protein
MKTTDKKIKVETTSTSTTEETEKEKKNAFDGVMPQNSGQLDMVIAFDTTGSMACYIEAVRKEVTDLIPRLFSNNEDLRLGIVAFGDYCDMMDAENFGDAYQCIMPTNNENDLIKFVRESKDTNGGDSDEFYELVINKIVDETPWRNDSAKSILLISDARPHPLGYSYGDIIVGNQIDWRKEAKKANSKNIKIDTVTITDEVWYKELSAMTDGVSLPFKSGYKTGQLVEATTMMRSSLAGSKMAGEAFNCLISTCKDVEMRGVYSTLNKAREKESSHIEAAGPASASSDEPKPHKK